MFKHRCTKVYETNKNKIFPVGKDGHGIVQRAGIYLICTAAILFKILKVTFKKIESVVCDYRVAISLLAFTLRNMSL